MYDSAKRQNNVDSGTVVVRSTFAVPSSEVGLILANIFHPLLKEQLLNLLIKKGRKKENECI